MSAVFVNDFTLVYLSNSSLNHFLCAYRAIQKGMDLMSEVYKENGNKLYLDDIENVVNPLEA